MIYETINLKDHYEALENDATITSYIPGNFDEWNKDHLRKCVIVIPGGGYSFISDREGEPVALRFTGKDIATFILHYTIAPKIHYPYPVIEVLAAVDYIRKNYLHFHVDPNKISVCGFSAGGHLAATASAYYHDKELLNLLKLKEEDTKINGCILAYPVISAEYGHKETIEYSTRNDPKLLDKLSIDKHVTPLFPKTYIFHTTFDTCVNLKNSLLLADALNANKIFFEMHIFPMHDHGQSVADRSVNLTADDKLINELRYNTRWVDEAIHFVEEYI